MASLDWSQCPAVESVPGRLSGAWVFRDTRMPVSAVFENLEAGASIEEIIEQSDITREQIHAVLEFVVKAKDRGWGRLTNGDLLAEAERAGLTCISMTGGAVAP